MQKEPLTSRETLYILEHLYDVVLNIEQMRRDEPPADSDDLEQVGIWYVSILFCRTHRHLTPVKECTVQGARTTAV